jgi:hypothetical protein
MSVGDPPPAEQTEQQRMSIYDAERQKLDGQLDKRLNICRGCCSNANRLVLQV